MGRKPVLIVGNGVFIVSLIIFGFAPSYKVALGSRAICGAFSGVVITITSSIRFQFLTKALHIISGAMHI